MKKVLSFVLVLAMILGCTSMAFAVTFKDQAEVTNTEAVAVLNAVGVLEGDDAGNMRPTATLTRAEACAIVARLMLGSTAAKKLTATVAPFKDVAADNWAAGYIAFCASEGIVAGVGNDKFNPTGTLKVGEFGKMLLCVLGYDAKTEGLTGSDWANNTAKLMVEAGLDVTQANSADCAREVAAQVALNALNATCVKYAKKGTDITIGNATISVGGDAAEAVEDKNEYNYNFKESDTALYATLQLAEKLYGDVLTVNNGSNVYGQPANTWYYNTDLVGTFVSKTPVMTATTAIKGADLYATLGAEAVLLYGNVMEGNVTKSGFYYGSTITTAALKVKDIKAAAGSIGGNGVITEVYKLTTGVYKVVQMVPVLAKVSAVANYAETSAHGAHTVYTLDKVDTLASGSATFTLTKYTTVVDKDTDKTTFAYDGTLAKEDYVMIYGPATKYVVSATTKVEGLLTGQTPKKSITIDGTKYSYAAKVNDNFGTSATVKRTVILDSYGYAKTQLDAAPQYLYVFEYATGVAFVDETTKKVTESDYMYAVLADGTFVETKASGAAAGDKGLYSYVVNAKTGVYTITVATSADVDTINQSATLKAGGNVYANNLTKYYVAQKTAGKYSGVVAYTGYANMPKLKNGFVAKALTATVTNQGLAKYVFVDYTAVNSADADYVYFVGSKSVDTTIYTTFDVVIAGKADTIKLEATSVDKGLKMVELGVAKDLVATNVAFAAGAGRDGVYTGAGLVTYEEGTLYTQATQGAVREYKCGVAEVPVYYFDALGACSVITVGELYQRAYSTLVIDVNAAGTAVEAIYICK